MSTLTSTVSDMDCDLISNPELRIGKILRTISRSYEIEADLPSLSDMEVDQLNEVGEVKRVYVDLGEIYEVWEIDGVNGVKLNDEVDEVASNKNEDVEDM